MANMSNKFLVLIFACTSLTACTQELAERKYRPSVDGYESAVAANMNQEDAERMQQYSSARPPVTVNNPYALERTLATTIPVLDNNAYGNTAYGGLNGGVIQGGVFMQNTMPNYQVPPTFGNSIYNPTNTGR